MPAPIPSPEEVASARHIQVWKEFIPLPLRFPLILFIIIVYMFSGGVYMSAVSEMSGSLSWITEDIMMAGYASMTGLTMAFPLLFRILFRFQPRSLLLFSAGVFIVSDYLCMVCDFLPLVVLLSFVSGFFKIVGTFVCWSNVQLKITPKRDFAVFFPFLFTFVLGSVQLANIVTGYSLYAFDWRAMHRITIGAFIVVFALVYFGMRHNYRQSPYIPFKGIDYLGGILWSLWLLCIVFICVYGDHYDWLDGEPIRVALLFAVVLLILCIQRAATIRHPYISLGAFSQHNMLFIFILFGCMTLMSATATSTQNVFTNSILGFDARHNADLNWGVLTGIAVGTDIFYLALTRWKWRVKSIVLAGFFSFLLYQVMLYFLIDASTEKYMLYLPLVFKGAGVSLVYTSLTYALTGSVTFVHYFEAMCVIGFIRTSFGAPLNSAILARLLKYASLENTATLGGEIDAMHPMAHSFMTLYGEFQRQILLVSLKEVYGYAVIVAIVILLAILASDYRWLIRPRRMWRLAQIWRVVHRQSKQLETTGE